MKDFCTSRTSDHEQSVQTAPSPHGSPKVQTASAKADFDTARDFIPPRKKVLQKYFYMIIERRKIFRCIFWLDFFLSEF